MFYAHIQTLSASVA